MNAEADKKPWSGILLVGVIVTFIIIVIAIGLFYSFNGERRTGIPDGFGSDVHRADDPPPPGRD